MGDVVMVIGFAAGFVGPTIGLIIGIGDETGMSVPEGKKTDSMKASSVIWGSRDGNTSHGISA